jgi:ubiquinone/menaquinone biosynthesis C-methylase UbiE
MITSDDPRSAYWNNAYLEYWKQRVHEAESSSTTLTNMNDAPTEGNWVYKKIFADHNFKLGNILDVGCAWGRMFPIYFSHSLRVSGIDISKAMVSLAKDNYYHHPEVDQLIEATAEEIPLPSDSFDNIVCVAVFDATYQEAAILEFTRVLKPGGKLYITGKSDRYAKSDQLAYNAEVGARSKGHPNFFTDLTIMRDELQSLGYMEVGLYKFPRRGDFAEFRTSTSIDSNEPFYEWFFVFELVEKLPVKELEIFSSEFSHTFLSISSEVSS